MSKFYKFSLFAAILAIVFAFAFSPSPVQANGEDTFNLTVRHNINGHSLGADKDLPVDVYVYKEGEFLASFTFSFRDTLPFELPAGEYYIEVKLGGDIIMTLGPVEIPAGANVRIIATLGAGKAPTLRAVVR